MLDRLRLYVLLAALAPAAGLFLAMPSALCEYQVIEVKDGGTISGSVSFVGNIPEQEMLVADKDLHTCGAEIRPSKKLIIDGKTRGIKNAVVYIRDITKGKGFGEKWHFVMDQWECEFTPHVLVIPVNSTLEVRNSDPIAHNVHAYSLKNATFNVSIPSRGKPITRSFPMQEMIKMGCDRHRWMRAWVVVMENPYFASTWFDGTFTITDVPPGSYRVSVWHEAFDAQALGAQTQEVTLKPGQEVRLHFKLSRD